MADDPESKRNEGLGPTHEITRSSVQQNKLENSTAVGSDNKSAKISEVNSDLQSNMDSRPTDSGNGILGKGKISFSFRKKPFNPSLVQYSDEDSATSEKEDGIDGKDQMNAKTGQSLLKSANLPLTTPKMTKEHAAFAEDLSEIPIPPDSGSCTHPIDSVSTKNRSPARIHGPTSIEQKYNTQYTKLLATKTRLEEKLKEIEQRGKKDRRNETESANNNMLVQQTASQAVSVEKMTNLKNDSLMLYEETDKVEIKQGFVQNLSQSSDVTNDLNLCNIDGKNAKVNQAAKDDSETNNLETCSDVCTKSESKLGLSTAKQDNQNNHADVCNVRNKLHRSPVPQPKIDLKKDDLSENGRQPVNSECADTDSKRTNAGSQLENESQNSSARVSKPKHKQSETQSDIKHVEESSLSSSSSSESEDDESSSSSTSSSSSSNSSDSEEEDTKVSDIKSMETSDHDSPGHKVLDASGSVSKTVVRKPENAELVDPSRQTTDTIPNQSVSISSELFSPYSPSKPTDEDADIDQTACCDTHPHTTRPGACSFEERCSIQGMNTTNTSVDSTECFDSKTTSNSPTDWDKDNEKEWSKEDHTERTLARLANQSSSSPKEEASIHLTSAFTSDTKHNDHESSLQYRKSYASATAPSCIQDNEERMISSDLHVSSEKVMEQPSSSTTSQEQHHYIVPPNAPSWNLVEITSNSSSKQHERSHHTKTADGSCKLAYNHSSALDSQTKYQTSLTSPEKHECVDERDRSHRERDHSRGHDWNYDRHRDYGRSRHHRSRDDERDAKTGWDRERDRRHDERFQRYRRSKSRDWDGKSRDRKSRSKERDRVSRSKEWDRRSRSKERDRHSRSRERDRRSKSRERDHYPRSRDQIKRSHSRERDHPSRPRDRDRRSGSRDRKRQSRSRDTIRRSRSRDRERRSRSRERETWSRSRRERRSRSRERRRSRDRYDRDYRRRSRRSPSCEHSDHHRLDDKRERHSSCHYRDEARSQRDHDRELRRTASTVVSTELENIPLPPAGYNLGETHSYLPADSVPIPTISQSYVPPPPPCFEEPLRPAIPERVPQTTPSQCQQRNLIYPPTVEMDNVSDIESVDMDVANSPDEAKTSEPGTRTSDVHSIPVISKRTAKDEKPAARVAFMMKTVPKKSAIYRQVLEVLDDDGSSKPSMSQLLPQDGTMTTAATCEQTAEHSQDPGYHISEPKSSGYSAECHQSVMAHTSSSSNDNATVGMIPLPGLIRATPESTQQQISDIPVPDSVQKGVSQSSSMQDILDESVSTVTTSAAHPVDVQSTSQLASTNESILKDNSEDKSEGEMQRAISAADDNSENETPLTRRRSLRLKSLEEKKEVRKDDVQETNRKKKRGRNDKGPEDATEASCESAENQPATSVDQSDGMSSSTPKSQFMSPEARDVKADDLGTPSLKPEKVKSRWRRWSELEASSTDGTPPPPPPPPQSSNEEPTESAATSVDNNDTSSEDGVPPPPPPQAAPTSAKDEAKKEEDTSAPSEPEEIPKPPEFELISEHVYVSDRKRSKCRKEARRMVCDCVLPTKEEYLAGHRPCGDECLNRMLFIECGSRCPCSEFCTNKRFQKRKYAKVETFYAGAKGWGLKTKHKIDPGAFIMEYVGEVLDYREFRRRSKQYSRSNMKHFYFMALNADEVIDATQKGNVSRFINHSCDPNCETQKWTVNGQLRIGFFAIRPVEPGEELTFDYQFESYGQAQKCYCGSENCRGYIGTTKKSPLKELTNKPTRKEKKKVFDDVLLEEEINDMMELEGMKKRSHVLELARLMVRAVSQEHRLALLKIIQDTKEPACLRLFLDYHGLSLLWSWMVDAAEGSTELKVSILNVLKQLPVTNKTVLKESNIMSIVERWAAQVNENKKEETKDEASESSSSGRGTPIVSGKESSQSTPTTPSYEGLPHKKRKLFQQLQQQEEASSSDGDTASESGKKDATSTKDDTDSQMGDPDSKESESEIDTAQMESEKRNGDWTSPLESDKPMPSVSDIASELISAWGNLKEVYKIPKICAEERKKTEQELDQRYGLDRHDVVGSNKEHKRLAGAADWSVNRDGKRRRLSSNRDDDTKGTKSKKVLLPTPPEASLSKQKRRALFEAQVKAQDEFVYQQQIQQQQLGQYPPGYQFDPNSPYPDPNLAQYPVQPGVTGYSSTPNVPIYPSEGSIGSFSDPNVSYSGTQDSTYVDPSVPGQVPAINTTVQTQMIVQPDGSYITAPQPVSTTFQQPAIASTVPDSSVQPAQFVDPNQTTESTIQPAVAGQSPATGQFVEQTPAPVVYQTPTQTQYQAPVATPFISQPVTATVGATPATVSYVVTPSQQAAPQYVQTQPVQQVYYTTPQGQVIVQQQPVVFQSQTQVVAVAEAAQGPRDPREPPPPPPSPPPKAKKRRLPPNWKTARDSEGKIYYYHTVTRQTQWDPPAWEEGQEDDMDLGTPTHDEPKTKKKTTTAAADTSTETAKRIKDHFRAKMSRLIVSYLNPYRRPDCKTGRITSTDDFKHLARKLTHTVLEKELKHCHHLEDLEVNENVKAKTKDYIKKYMSRFGPVYKKATTSP